MIQSAWSQSRRDMYASHPSTAIAGPSEAMA